MRIRTLLLGLALSLLLGAAAGCGDDDDLDTVATSSSSTTAPNATALPDGQPSVVGIVSRADDDADPVLVDASAPYFEGMALLRGDPVILDGSGDRTLTAADLSDGTEVAVWTADACAESYPVQCEILALQVRR